jgi:acyl-CoA thioesterase I
VNRRALLLACAPLAVGLALATVRLLPGETQPVSCAAPRELTRIDAALVHSAASIAATGRLTVVAVGSSSTLGTGASSPSMSYPSRLQEQLEAALPGVAVTVVNRGVGGQDVGEEVGRLPRDVIAVHPDLAIWQVGTNAVLRHDDLAADTRLIRRGLALLTDHRIDVVLMDLQYAPRVLRRRAHGEMERVIADAARRAGVGLFHRYAMMRRWAALGQFGRTAMIGPDGLHMTDASYGCLAADLAQALVADLGGASPPYSRAATARTTASLAGTAASSPAGLTIW